MLTDKAIKQMKPPAVGQKDVADGTDVGGLILRLSAGGSKTFYLVYRSPIDGKRARIRIGEYSDGKHPGVSLSAARSKGRQYRQLIDEGADPRDHERKQAELRAYEQEQAWLAAKRAEYGILSRAVDDFLAQCRKSGQRRWQERERQLRRYLRAEWQCKHLDDISRDDCRALLELMEAENGHVQANRVMQTLRALYNWAIREGRCERNPAAKLRSAVREVSRDRVGCGTSCGVAGSWQPGRALRPVCPVARSLRPASDGDGDRTLVACGH